MATTFPKTRCGICTNFFQMTAPDGFLCPSCQAFDPMKEPFCHTVERAKSEFHEAKSRFWASLCPPLYRDSDIARLPAVAVQASANYTFSPVALAFIGPARIGKTRTMFQLMARLIRQEHRLDGQYRCLRPLSTRWPFAESMSTPDHIATRLCAASWHQVDEDYWQRPGEHPDVHSYPVADLLQRTGEPHHPIPALYSANAGAGAESPPPQRGRPRKTDRVTQVERPPLAVAELA